MYYHLKLNRDVITPDNQKLKTFSNKVNHSPDGFMWGYNGSGPAQLAFAILYNEFKLSYDENQIFSLYQKFKEDIISKLDKDKEHFLERKIIQEWFENNLKVKK